MSKILDSSENVILNYFEGIFPAVNFCKPSKEPWDIGLSFGEYIKELGTRQLIKDQGYNLKNCLRTIKERSMGKSNPTSTVKYTKEIFHKMGMEEKGGEFSTIIEISDKLKGIV